MFGFSSSRSKGRFYPLFITFSLLLSFGVHAECDCCGLTNDIAQIVANAALANCSSNCVRMTPEDCVNLRSNLLAYVDGIDANATSVYSALTDLIELSNGMFTELVNVTNDLTTCVNALQSTNSIDGIYAYIQSARNNLVSWTNQIKNIDMPVTSNSMVYSNKLTHVSITLNAMQKITPHCQTLLNYIDRIEQYVNDYSVSNELQRTTALYSLQQVLSSFDSLGNALYDISMTASFIQPYFQSIEQDSVRLRALTESMACESCGSGGGTNNQVNGIIDITPIVNAINDLQDRLDYWMNRLYDLLYKYYDDYRYAAFHAPSGTPSLSTYENLPANWFSRVEYLLYAISDISNSDSSTDAPTSPVGGDALDSFVSDSSSSKSQQDDALSDLNSSSFSRLRTSIQNFVHVYDSWGLTDTDITGSLVMTFPSDLSASASTSYQLTVPADFSSYFSILKTAFKFLWWVALAFLYFYFCKLAFSIMCSYAKWFLTICSAVFG